jgi:hypothetical protein
LERRSQIEKDALASLFLSLCCYNKQTVNNNHNAADSPECGLDDPTQNDSKRGALASVFPWLVERETWPQKMRDQGALQALFA